MFGKKRTIEPQMPREDVLIQVTDPITVSKKLNVSVPTQYKAIAFINQQPLFRIEPCVSKDFVKTYGKAYIGDQLRIAFVANRTLAQSAWGFGNIQVNNEGLKETYRVGANGKFTIEITDYAKLIQAFPNENAITIDQIREKSISTLKTVGVPILADYFSKTTTSVFEMSSLIADFRNKFADALQDEKIFASMGIKIATLTVDGFHANEEDLELIRNRING